MKFRKKDIATLILFLIIQIVWFNQVLLFGFLQPILILFPILTLPLNTRSENILLAFVLGIITDTFLHTGGVFAASLVLIVYLRNVYFSFVIKQYQDKNNFNIHKIGFYARLMYYGFFIFLSYFFIYLFESFYISLVIKKIPVIMLNTIVSLVLFVFLDTFLISNNQKR